MTKVVVKGKKRRVKSKIRKAICTTMSAIFMVSAILVAAIPVDTLEADSATSVTLGETNIPEISDYGKIYTTGDDMFQFAYVENATGGSDKIAVIVGYTGGTLPGGVLTIPDTVDGYKATEAGRVAVTMAGDLLYYPVYKEVVSDVSDNTIVETVLDRYEPCYYDDAYRSKWIDLEYNELYCKSGDTYVQVADPSKMRMKDVPVAYIANQYLVETTFDGNGVAAYELAVSGESDSEDTKGGVFTKNGGNIVKLVTGDNLLGIGNYAFYGCANLSGIQLSNGANTIGKYAFANCHNLTTADIDLHAAINVSGEYAFQNCDGLQSFTVPISVTKICDRAFENCSSMTSIALCGEDYNTSLQQIGEAVFKGCSSLRELVFPSSFVQNSAPLKLSLVEDCFSLQNITIKNNSLYFEGTEGEFNTFKSTVSEEFYFAGNSESKIHKQSATPYSIAFKYLDSPYWYEKVIKEKDDDGNETGYTMTYRVDEENNLRYFKMDDEVQNVEIPGAIGPYRILKIGTDSFRNMCRLKKITIPSSIVAIEDYAFQGCHNLESVVFEEPINLSSIGVGAFETQVVQSGKKCEVDKGKDEEDKRKCVDIVGEDLQPLLSFTGTIDPNSLPFLLFLSHGHRRQQHCQATEYLQI
ncbi:MAG: leucine-rich repeat domain-containing protein, partial [Lachnospiraceae bacterium]|nr:leucine-rich repeat domain-containing protein [Lachnospiraceae bacterium]